MLLTYRRVFVLVEELAVLWVGVVDLKVEEVIRDVMMRTVLHDNEK